MCTHSGVQYLGVDSGRRIELYTAVIYSLIPRAGHTYSTEASFYLIHPPKKVCACARVPVCPCQIILVLVYVSRISSALKIRICRYVCTRATSPPQKKEQKALHRLRERHTHSATVIAQQGACNNYGQRYRGCTCCLMDTESLMIRRPFGSIDPNSIRETELHTECRRRRERESLNSRRVTGRGMLLVRGLPLRV